MKYKKHRIGIIGVGMVGGSLRNYFQKKDNYEVFLYDKGQNLGSINEINKADFIYVCVPTPYKKDIGCDMSIVEEVIGYLHGSKIIIIKSTIEPGTTSRLQKKFLKHKILFNPEFLTEMTADQDMSYPDRQIVGYTKQSYGVAKEILLQLPLAPFERIMPATSAEMIKYAGNCWFATKVAFANQLYDLCQKVKTDYKNVLEGMSADKRIGRTHLKIFHKGYRGFGGACLPKDSKALIELAKKKDVNLSILSEVDRYNDELLISQGFNPLDTDKSKKDIPMDEESYSSSKELKIEIELDDEE